MCIASAVFLIGIPAALTFGDLSRIATGTLGISLVYVLGLAFWACWLLSFVVSLSGCDECVARMTGNFSSD